MKRIMKERLDNNLNITGEENRWVINRIGLINFWYYDEEEFSFENGRLLLRGANGSGKSVTMQSFIPLLLDGNKSPERLDPFGSRARKLENYLLGEEEDAKDENTGYLYMEFRRQNTGNHLTIGMGLRAKRGKPLDFWGFALTDGRRIGYDFFLYKETGEKIPLSKIELRNRIGSGGELHDAQSDYMEMVNRLLFGFESLEEYDELIKLLVQLRTPKLSKEFRPTVIYEIMNNSLQPLSDEDLRPMSEAIENMDNIKTQLEVLKESKKAADKLKSEYDKYNRFVLYEKTRDCLTSQERLDKAINEEKELSLRKEELSIRHTKAEEEMEELKALNKSLEHKKEELEQHDSFKASLEIGRIEQRLKELGENRTSKAKTLELKKDRERNKRNESGKIKAEQDDMEGRMSDLLEEMSGLADDIKFFEHDYFRKELEDDFGKEYDYKLFRKDVDNYRKRIEDARRALEEEKGKIREYDKAQEELESARKAREDARKYCEKTENVLGETKSEFVEKTYSWEKANKYLKLSTDDMSSVVRLINGYGLYCSYDDIKMSISSRFNVVDRGINEDILRCKSVKEALETETEKKREELARWKSQKDPEPDREPKVIANRKRLEEAGIPFIPFYKAVDFREKVEDELKGRLEEALADMGLLDALIISARYREKLIESEPECGDKYIFAKPQFFRQDLSQYLKPVVFPDSAVTYEQIDDVLRSIVMDDENEAAYINEKGAYSIGLIKGHASSVSKPRFLGAEARRIYRQENIARLEAEIDELKHRMDEQQMKIDALEEVRRILKEELNAFPSKDDLETALKMVEIARLEFDSREKEVGVREAAADKVYRELKEIKEKVRELTVRMELPQNLEAYEQASEDMRIYRDKLSDLENAHMRYCQACSRLKSLDDQLEELLSDIDAVYIDLRKIDNEIRDCNEKKATYEEMLKELGFDEIRKQIEECIAELNRMPEKRESAARYAESLKNELKNVEEKLARATLQTKFLRIQNRFCIEAFRREYSLGYVMEPDEEKDILRAAKKAFAELKSEEKSSKQREDFARALQERYHENIQYLLEYNLTLDFIFDEIFDETDKYDEAGGGYEDIEFDERLAKPAASQKRLDLSAKVHGKNVSFNTLVRFIEESIEENEKLLRESDRQLFEDILANTVGKKIRARIYHSEQWVKKMNRLMESMNTSSGLSFNLVWKSRTAETEEQIDTKELVDLLKADSRLLSEEQMESLASHFRSKIAQARKELEQKGAVQSFHAIMKDILDYRKWFEFQLFYTKTGESRKELTNNAFYRLSGGEKAMAMYVPLFSAVYARYEGARKDCPRIISLDEAFAGVDENNIRDMFRLIEELRLNFIINSQILWGDYDTIPELSICELVRPNNADFVTVIRYRWNGKVRELVTDGFDEEKSFEEAAAALEK